MSLRHDAPLLGDFPLEPVGLGDIGGQGRIPVADPRAAQFQHALAVMGQHRQNHDLVAVRHAEERRNPPAPADPLQNQAAKVRHGEFRNVLQRQGLAVMELRQCDHFAIPPSSWAASCSRSASGPGRYTPSSSASTAKTMGGRTAVTGSRTRFTSDLPSAIRSTIPDIPANASSRNST